MRKREQRDVPLPNERMSGYRELGGERPASSLSTPAAARAAALTLACDYRGCRCQGRSRKVPSLRPSLPAILRHR